MCTSVVRVVDAKYSLTLSVSASPASAALSLEFTCTTRPKLLERRNGRESFEELGHTIVLGLARVHPNTTKQSFEHCYPLRAPVKAVVR